MSLLIKIQPALADTLSADSATLAGFQIDHRLDYARELAYGVQQVEQESFLDFLNDWINGMLRTIFSSSPAEARVWTIVGVLVILVIVVYLFLNKVGFFTSSGDDTESLEQADNIYGVDFDKQIRLAESKGDFREATRLTYLKTLRWLADHNRIQWTIYKTPVQYTYEETDHTFRQMTNEFLRIRYGNFEATENTLHQMRQSSIELIDRITPLILSEQNMEQPEEGGEQS